ncbi:stalled ribosome sensor GCN1 [Onthophagus taurus]|uniref:stalled ribosome sensor GCN1 n=1 Tax=Onthophagus taurus TaxID=166361 RepID=UPI0039BE0584
MGDPQISSILKDVYFKMQETSLKGRKESVDYIIENSPNDLDENSVKEICKVLYMVIPLYEGSYSQHLIKKLLHFIANKQIKPTIKFMLPVYLNITNQYKSLIATTSTSKNCLYLLRSTCILYEYASKSDRELLQMVLPKLVEIQSILYTSIASIGTNKRTSKAIVALKHSWQAIPDSGKLYLDILKSMEQSPNVIILSSAVCQYLSSNNELEQIKPYKPSLIDTFIKSFVTCKKKPQKTYVQACYPFLKTMTYDEFSKSLLPALQKALLRSPEVIVECVGLVLGGLTIDISDCAFDIGKSLSVNLHSTDDLTRDDAVFACKMMAEKIKSVSVLDKIVTHICGVFNGSDGKLTVITHKISVLLGVGNLSYHDINGSNSIQLTTNVINQFVKIFETEVNEKVLCCALDVLGLWCANYCGDNPKKLIDSIKSGMDNKNSTPTLRISYIKFMTVLFKGNKISHSLPLIPTLLKSIDRAVAQPAQAPIVTEGLFAACFILKVTATETPKDNLHNFWNTVCDLEKQLFLSEKYLSLATEEAFECIFELSAKLLLDYQEKIKGDPEVLYKAMLFCLTSGSYENSRQKCLNIARKELSKLGGVALIRNLLQQFTKFANNKIQVKNEKDFDQIIPSSMFITCITTLCSQVPTTSEDVNLIAVDALLPCHHPVIMVSMKNLWETILKHLKVCPKNLIAQHSGQIKKLFIYEYEDSQVYENALTKITSINANVIFDDIVMYSISHLSNQKILEITKDDYFIYLTPEGDLYDKSVLPGDEYNNAMNMKRESKAYSYKEQLEEMQLRRELEDKKKKEGKVKEPQYTPKQLEAIKNQKAKEQAIREKLTELNTTLLKVVSMLQASFLGNPQYCSFHLRSLLPFILSSMQSPLAAPHLTKLYLNLRKAVFSERLNLTGEKVANLTLRLEKPSCDLDPAWQEFPLEEAMNNLVEYIHFKTVKSKLGLPVAPLTTPALAYSFSLLRNIIIAVFRKNETTTHMCLEIFSEHVKIDNDDELYSPVHLPRKQMFELLIDLIGKTQARLQSQAEVTLLDIANASSTNATMDEIVVLLESLKSQVQVVRDAGLRGLLAMKSSFPTAAVTEEDMLRISKQVWITKFDVIEENRELAEKLWQEAYLDFPPCFCTQLIKDLEYPVECIQIAISEALAALLSEDREQLKCILTDLIKLYKDRLNLIAPKLDEFGREIEKPIDVWHPRRGVALALGRIAPLLDYDVIGELIEFFVSTSLGDRQEKVRKEMLAAALKIVDLHGKDTVSTLLPVFENFLDKSSKQAHFDAVKQAVVVLMGSLARHLDKDDARIKPIVMRLIQALSTPSQQVQESVANCLPFLVPSIKDEAPGLVNKLLHQLIKSDKYGERKGAAYGLAGLVKGMGILALKQLDIMTKLTDAIQDKKNYKHREGALFAFEMLFQMLGKLFEPYIVHVLPHLLQCFGDSSQYVRNATDDMAKVVMSKLSGHGVKLVLPALLGALEEDSWRTKTGSIELLGAMAYCAPKQLSSCLPSIVPKLIEVLSDSHTKVQEAGTEALRVIGSVIRNPEIQAIVPVLLQAVQDPSNKTSNCLQVLLDTQFVHFIDAPSLALIMPVVQRAFMDRSTETRKMAAQIIGNMYSLTDQKDLAPYLPTIIPGLKTSLLDPVPEVRSVSARALGAMVRGMGESSFEDLLPWLMQTLTSESSSVDRSGAAQGLSEVVGGLGVEKLHKLMPEIIATAERTDIAPHVKDGYIMMFIYMPVVFTTEFTPYIGQIINPILKALADENEYVRDTALKAGQRIVNLYADSAILLLLPELERGLFDDNWRIRYSSVQLLGDLLYRISGVTGKMSTETASEDDNFGTEQSHLAIIQALGAERRNRVLAGLYMGRSDVALMVRQAALHVWKVVVTNTPRTLREILPTLFSLLLGCLASDSYDKRQVAARTLGDLVRKLGERVLPEIIPILEHGLKSDQPDQRQGVCIGLSEIMTSTSKEMVLTFVNSLVPTVRKALCDPLPEVRQAAAKTFDSLHSTVGSRALDDILPPMLNQLNNSDDAQLVEWTLDGLRQVMAIKSRVVLPYLVPQLTAPPPNTKALSILSSVAGEALNKYLPRILPALQTALADAIGTPEETQQLEYCQAVVLSVMDETGIRTVIDTLLESSRTTNVKQRKGAVTLLCAFCANSKAQYTTHVPQLLRGIVHLCTDSDKEILRTAWEALNAVTKSLDSKQLSTYVPDVRQAVRYAISDMKGTSDTLPGFCLPKGILPILPIFREAILNGDGDEKEAAAQGLGEVIKVTNAQALQPCVVAITGPLIRILGDRFSANVKIAVLETLALLLAKVGAMLKQFIPQLQTTFLKALNDQNRTVRLKAAGALSHLISIHQKPETLFLELHGTVKSCEESAIRETTLHALRGIVAPAGDKISDSLRKQIHSTLIGLLSYQEDTTRLIAAGCLGALCKWLPPEQLNATITEHILTDSSCDWMLKHGRAAALSVSLKECPEVMWVEQYQPKIEKTILSQLTSDTMVVTQTAIRSCGYLLQYLMMNDLTLPINVLGPFVKQMNNNSNDVKQLFAKVCIHLAKIVPANKMTPEFLKLLLPMLVNGTKEKNSYVKANSEIALIAVLRLKEGDEMNQKCLSILDIGARESLQDVISKVLKKIMLQPEGKEDELDDTLLT